MENVAVKIGRERLTWAGKEASAFKKNKNNLVKFFESFTHKGQMCVVLETLDISLYDFMKVRFFKALPLSDIRVVSQQTLVALNALKSIGLARAHIRPDNVMLVNHQLQPLQGETDSFGFGHSSYRNVPWRHHSGPWLQTIKDSTKQVWRLNTQTEYVQQARRPNKAETFPKSTLLWMT